MDPSFVIPRLITELILPGINDYFNRKNFHTSYSQIIPALNPCRADLTVTIERLRETLKTGIEISGASESDKKKIAGAIKESVKETPFVLQMVSGREIKGSYLSRDETYTEGIASLYQFTIALRDGDHEIFLVINLHGRFFNILIPSLDTSYVHENIAEHLTPFFKKPDILYPSIEMLLSKLGSRELSGLLDLLRKNNHLSDYQLVLLINGFPEHSLKIKDALSKNRQESLREELKKYRGRVTKEEISCGIYSIEESLEQVLKKEKNYIAEHFRIFSSLIRRITDYELYMRKEWDEWISEMDQKNLLYKTLLKCSDQVLRDSFSGYTEEKYPFFIRHFSAERLMEIFAGNSKGLPGSAADARVSVIKNYRSLAAEAFRFDHEDFTYILASVKSDPDFEIIVRHTGWFILSTALKQCGKKLQDRVTGGINHPASVLIRGVISGTINPDIIHDEIQVNRARSESVRIILQLFEDGLIELEI